MKYFLTFILCACCLTTTAADWFVRPGSWTKVDGSGFPIPTVGVYGNQNGTNYDNAWNGIRSVAWGAAGVNSNDTLYVCGVHVYKFIAGAVPPGNSLAVSLIKTSNVTIRMDWPADPGTLFGGAFNFYGAGAPYTGPDSNGVYKQVLLSSQTPPPIFYVNNGTNITRLKKRTAVTWADGLGGQFLNGNTNYVQLPDGAAPETNTVAAGGKGWAFDLNCQSNIVFQSCRFISMNFQDLGLGAIRHSPPPAPYAVAANHITFTNCTSFDSAQFYLYPGENNFSLLGCEIARTPTAIYSLLNSTAYPPQQMIVSNCWIHDIGTPEYHDLDNNAIGIQGGNYHVITHNVISNTGGAVILWTGGGIPMRTNTISYNFIINTQTNSSGSSTAIAISGLNNSAPPGTRTGNQIFGNIIVNCAVVPGAVLSGYAMDLNSQDYTPIFNNTIVGGSRGIQFVVPAAGVPVSAKIVNNIIVQPSDKYYYVAGSATPTNLVVDYNLYYPTTALVSSNSVVSPNNPGGVNSNSVFGNPLFLASPPLTAVNATPYLCSPAVDKATPVGLVLDILGNCISPTLPDIGAVEYTGAH